MNVVLLVLVAAAVVAAIRAARRQAAPRPLAPEPSRGPADALVAAVTRGDADALRRAAQAGEDLEARSMEGVSPLGQAIALGDAAVVRALLEAGVDPNAPARRDEPALLVAAAHGRAALVPGLLAAGAAPEYTHPDVGSALMAAVAQGHDAAFDALLAAGVSSGLRNESGAQAVHFAAYAGRRRMLERLLRVPGADVDERTFPGGTPLRAAADQGHAELVQLLLAAGADPAPVDDFGRTPADDARDHGHAEVVALLGSAAAPQRTGVGRSRTRRNPLAQMLPPRDDATLVGVARGLAAGDPALRSACSALEAPSMLGVVWGLQPEWEFTCRIDTDPDPRLPCRPVEFQLWTYHRHGKLQERATVAAPHPPAPVRRQVARLAEVPYLLRVWSDRAARAAAALDGVAPQEALAVMVHAPAGPRHLQAWDWVFRVQVAAALVASHAGRGAWKDSARRAALEDVLDGPADWACTAAILALRDVARRDPADEA